VITVTTPPYQRKSIPKKSSSLEPLGNLAWDPLLWAGIRPGPTDPDERKAWPIPQAIRVRSAALAPSYECTVLFAPRATYDQSRKKGRFNTTLAIVGEVLYVLYTLCISIIHVIHAIFLMILWAYIRSCSHLVPHAGGVVPEHQQHESSHQEGSVGELAPPLFHAEHNVPTCCVML
jgi:hypothetical protein